MKPYNREYILNVLKEYNNAIKDETKGSYKISRKSLEKSNLQGYMYKNEYEYDEDIIELSNEDGSIMRLEPKEIEGCHEAISYAQGRVGIVGLGLGYVVHEISKKINVDEIIVYEISQEVIDLYKDNFGHNDKIKIICTDAFKAEREKFDFFFADIYGYELTSRVVEDYKRFNEIHEIEEYSFWGMEHFLLSCKYEDLLWVYIPENWVAMCKSLYAELQASNYIDNYEPLDEGKVTKILYEFKEVLNADM